MRTCTQCPACHEMLTLVATPPTLACPFCRSTIAPGANNIPVGKKVRCARCLGVFTAESPPAVIRLYLASVEPCPFCKAPLAIRHGMPTGKKVRCCQCRKVFRPRRNAGVPQVVPAAELPESKPGSNAHVAPNNPVSKTRLGPRSHSGKSSITHLAAEALPQASADVDLFQRAATKPARDDDEIDLFGPEAGEAGSPVNAAPERNGTPPVAADAALLHNGRPPVAAESVAVEPLSSAQAVEEEPPQLEPTPAPPPPEARARAKRNQSRSPKPGPARKRQASPAPMPVPMPTPQETVEADAAVHAMDHDDAVGSNGAVPQAEVSRADTPRTRKVVSSSQALPLSSGTLERMAADAILDDDGADDVTVEADSSDPEIATATAPPRASPPSPPASVARPMPAKPAAGATSPRASAGSSGQNLDARKLLLYGGTAVFLLLLAGGIYYLVLVRSKPRVYPVEGIVLFEGKPPAAGTRVTLFPMNSKRDRYFPTGKVGPDGTFKLTTFQSEDGAPAGRYMVTVERRLEMEEYTELSKNPAELARKQEEMSQDPINMYATPNASLTRDITKGPNRLELQLVFKDD